MTPTQEPGRLQADAQDVALARTAVTHQAPAPLPQNEIDPIKDALTRLANRSTNEAGSGATNNVPQWQPDWMRYDPYHRSVIVTNPFRDPVKIVYGDPDAPQVLTIPPLASLVTAAAQLAISITAIVLDSHGNPKDVGVGTFPGGEPGCHKDVPVVVKYSHETYQPFVVDCITDVGGDPSVGGAQKVIIDNGTPAWGRWTQTETGQRQFEVNKTQQFPGLDKPAEGPLPGYQLLASTSESTSGLGGILLILLAAVAAGLAAIVVRILRAKQHGRHGRVDARVHAVSRPGGPPAVTMRENPGEATHAVRLETHTGTDTLTIREVDDDHRRPE